MQPSSRALTLAILVFTPALCLACDPHHWRYVSTLTPPSNLSALIDGAAVALSDTTAVVGKLGSPGAVDLFKGAQGVWTFQKRLSPQPGATGAFGVAVAMDGDRLAVGAPAEGDGVHNGYVDIYTRSGGQWSYEQTVVPTSWNPPLGSGTQAEFNFGSAVDLAGDLLVVGAGRFRGGYGRAFVFKLNAGTYAQVAELQEAPADQRFDSNFGDSVRIDGNTIVVTRPDTPASTPPPKAGKVYAYTISGANFPLQQVILSNTANGNYDGFGTAVALDGNRLAVRSRNDVQVFTRNGGTWSYATSVSAGQPQRATIDLQGEYLVIGEPQANSSAGQIRVLIELNGAYQSQAVRSEPSPAPNHNFGSSVALHGNELLVGVPGAYTPNAYSATLDYIDGPY
jgi:hypothetical protein